MNTSPKSIYALLVSSEEKGRTLLETILYSLCILSAVAAIWQFAQQRVELSAPGLEPCVACANVSGAPVHG